MGQNIVLVYPNAGQDVLGINVGLPLSILYVGTALKKAGYDVTLLDERIHKNFAAVLKDAVAARPLYVGISSTARHPLVDIVVVNEGEETAVELAQVIASGGDLRQVRGVALKENGRIVRTLERPQMALETLPRVDYSLVNLIDYFTIGHISRSKQLQIVTSRCCPFRCSYCYLTLPDLRGYRWLSAERVYDDIKFLSESYGLKSIFFYDDYFFGNRKRVLEFVEMLEEKPLGVQFEVSCRIDFLARESEELLARLARVGFTELLIGVESGSDRILKLIKKDYRREQIIVANRKMAKAGIGAKMSWLAGFPTETAEDFYQTVDLMLQLARENPQCSLTPLGIYT